MAPSSGPPRKRTRKRKRRALSTSSSSSSSSSEIDVPVAPKAPPIPVKTAEPSSSADDSDEESSSGSDSSSSDSDTGPYTTKSMPTKGAPTTTRLQRRDSPSPPPQSPTLPSFLPPPDSPNVVDAEKEMKERFRKFWMASVADGFKDDLEQLRVKEPNLGQSRLALLIDSLASGADVFSSTTQADGVNEMQVLLG
ncbi:Rsa3 domain-containing protein [Mycena chlorophos]|uniref:Ribosome assembly protein 3 n=1 Tax=Mycena chlorophos TaxID=658473 RepID=A0A8H6SV48_MYCCL|nr:Rsa3 domain-containing protein [Mycena chlorophos]